MSDDAKKPMIDEHIPDMYKIHIITFYSDLMLHQGFAMIDYFTIEATKIHEL